MKPTVCTYCNTQTNTQPEGDLCHACSNGIMVVDHSQITTAEPEACPYCAKRVRRPNWVTVRSCFYCGRDLRDRK